MLRRKVSCKASSDKTNKHPQRNHQSNHESIHRKRHKKKVIHSRLLLKFPSKKKMFEHDSYSSFCGGSFGWTSIILNFLHRPIPFLTELGWGIQPGWSLPWGSQPLISLPKERHLERISKSCKWIRWPWETANYHGLHGDRQPGPPVVFLVPPWEIIKS